MKIWMLQWPFSLGFNQYGIFLLFPDFSSEDSKTCAHSLATTKRKPEPWNDITCQCLQEQLSLLRKTSTNVLRLCGCSACLPPKHDLQRLVTEFVPLSARCVFQGSIHIKRIQHEFYWPLQLKTDYDIYIYLSPVSQPVFLNFNPQHSSEICVNLKNWDRMGPRGRFIKVE